MTDAAQRPSTALAALDAYSDRLSRVDRTRAGGRRRARRDRRTVPLLQRAAARVRTGTRQARHARQPRLRGERHRLRGRPRPGRDRPRRGPPADDAHRQSPADAVVRPLGPPHHRRGARRDPAPRPPRRPQPTGRADGLAGRADRCAGDREQRGDRLRRTRRAGADRRRPPRRRGVRPRADGAVRPRAPSGDRPPPPSPPRHRRRRAGPTPPAHRSCSATTRSTAARSSAIST